MIVPWTARQAPGNMASTGVDVTHMEYSGSAELAFAGLAEKVYGAVSHITDKSCVVRLQQRPEGADTLPVGMQVEVTMHISGPVFNAPAEVASDANGEIRLNFMAPVRRFQTR